VPLALALIKGLHGNAFLVVGDGRFKVLARGYSRIGGARETVSAIVSREKPEKTAM
jgi:hypothetical protein